MKTLELNNPKMSLLSINGRLSISEMEGITAGSCNPHHQVLFASAVGLLFFGGWGALIMGGLVQEMIDQNNGSCI
ncbi:MAG: hypothetical protein CVT96_05505 [Bacteroidetes bacterium HGW-Bacteroidetes-13]|nr:MAG: hypothetical protein CVT96_05505 [Bacteroidetes bacterium HGW-Bacteroidetes-13]